LKYKINFIFDWRVKLKRKNNLTKSSKNNQKMRTKLKKTNISQIGIKSWNWEIKSKFYKITKQEIRNQKNKILKWKFI